MRLESTAIALSAITCVILWLVQAKFVNFLIHSTKSADQYTLIFSPSDLFVNNKIVCYSSTLDFVDKIYIVLTFIIDIT